MNPPDFKEKLFGRNWLLGLAVVLTTLWLVGGIAYIGQRGGSLFLLSLRPDEIGGFLEGFLAPLAFLWLVIGLFIQQQELAKNTAVLRQTNLNSSKQTEVLAATELRARQSAFFQIAENVRRQTGNIAGMMVESLEDEQGNPIINLGDLERHWRDHQGGDYERFPTLLMQLSDRAGGVGLDDFDVFYGTIMRRRYTEEYMKSFRGLVQSGRACDEDGTIWRTITQTPHGQVYATMLERIKPPSCWVLMQNVLGFASPTAGVEPSGAWRLEAETVFGSDEWITDFRRTANGIEGTVNLGDEILNIQDAEMEGSSLFGRIAKADAVFVLTASVHENLITGQLDTRDGIFATFEGQRVVNSSPGEQNPTAAD